MEYQLKHYEFSTSDKSDVVTWGNDAFWRDWSKLRDAGYLVVTNSGSPGDYGHITVEITDQTKSLYPRTVGLRFANL